MTRIRRLEAVCAALGLAAALTCASVWGEMGHLPKSQRLDDRNPLDAGAPADTAVDALAASKFSKSQVVTYRTRDGENLFALQAKPKLEAAAPRPIDYLIMVDTSASQVGHPLSAARTIVQTLVAKATPNDRVSLWTVNTPRATRDLTRGFQAPLSEELSKAVKTLNEEVPLGDTDLKGGLERVVKNAFGSERDRQRVLIFLGDGMSTHSPINQAERVRMCKDMVDNQIAFFSVPLGPKFDAKNLHGFATGTGGRVIRVWPKETVVDVVANLQKAVAQPILYPTKFRFETDGVTEFYPATLPPLRSDVPTLVMGRFKGGATLTYSVEGTIAGNPVQIKATEPVTAPEVDNFFLVTMLDQWKNAREQPALMQADRALVLADQLNHVRLAELLGEGEILVQQNNFEGAAKVFQRATDLNPADTEAHAGLKLVQMLRDGKITKDQVLNHDREGVMIRKDANGKQQIVRGKLKDLVARLDREEQAPPPPGAVPAVPPGAAPPPNTLLEQQRLRLAVAEQRSRQVVDDALRQARRLNPDDARDLLKNVLAGINDDPDLRGTRTQALLTGQLEASIRNVEQRAIVYHRDQAEQLQLLALAEQRVQATANQQALEERTRERMRVFHALMNQARYTDAYRQALAIQQDAINQGNPVPTAATAAYDMGLISTNLREQQDLRRKREERYLLTMLQVDRSNVPFPDEPPIEFPPAATWRELTRIRKEKYESSGLIADDEQTLKKVRRLRDMLQRPISVSFPPNTTIDDAVDLLQAKLGITILIDSQAFKDDPDLKDQFPEGIEKQTVTKLPKLNDISAATVLRLVFAPVGGTYVIRRDYVEITTAKVQAAEKVLRAYPVADLVTPIPNGFSQAGVGQNLSVFGQTVSIGGVAGGGLLGAGGLGGIGGLQLGGALGIGGGLGGLGGGLGGLGGGLGGLGGLGGGLGGLGGGMMAMGGVGGIAGGAMGAGMGVGGQLGFQGGGMGQNFGVGGGFLGIGGGQLGQFGNQGGQFGLQGGDQSMILIQLIINVVGTSEDWPNPKLLLQAQGQQQLPGSDSGNEDDTEDQYAKLKKANTLLYYPPARALVVKGTSRINTSLTGGLLSPRGAAAAGGGGGNERGALDKPDDGNRLARLAHPHRAQNDKQQVAAATGAQSAQEARKRLKAQHPSDQVTDLDARKIWNDALAKGGADVGLIIATADFLVEHKKFNHAAEFLKAALRQGIVHDPWVYDALAIALKESHASPDEIERAELSVVDLQPQNATGYLQASTAMADQKRWDRAVAFCQQAAELEPNTPAAYEKALGYAETATDVPAMTWAASNLLGRDWPVDNEKLHQEALEKLHALAEQVRGTSKADVTKLHQAERKAGERDLIIKLGWEGEADLDLDVREPIGTACSFRQHQSPGGGTLMGDSYSDPTHETYVAAEAFPGQYEIKVHRIWGRPIGSKATLHIIEHQGTPQQKDRWETLVFDREGSLTITLDSGRRKSPAQVPPEALVRALRHSQAKLPTTAAALKKLRNMANPQEANGPVDMQVGVGGLAYPAPVTPPAAVTPAGDTKVPPALLKSLIDSSAGTVDNPIIPGGKG